MTIIQVFLDLRPLKWNFNECHWMNFTFYLCDCVCNIHSWLQCRYICFLFIFNFWDSLKSSPGCPETLWSWAYRDMPCSASYVVFKDVLHCTPKYILSFGGFCQLAFQGYNTYLKFSVLFLAVGGGVPFCFIHIFFCRLHIIGFFFFNLCQSDSFKKLSCYLKVAFSLWVTLNIFLSTCISFLVVYLSVFLCIYVHSNHPLLIFLGLLVFFFFINLL